VDALDTFEGKSRMGSRTLLEDLQRFDMAVAHRSNRLSVQGRPGSWEGLLVIRGCSMFLASSKKYRNGWPSVRCGSIYGDRVNGVRVGWG
jgi:hypothetical protein